MLILGVMLIMSLGLIACYSNNKPTEDAQSGAFFATGNRKEYAVVYENSLSIFFGYERCDTFQFVREGDYYIGENIRIKANIKFINNELSINITGMNGYSVPNKELILYRNDSIKTSNVESVQITAPEKVEINTHDLRWQFEDLMGEGELVGSLLRSNGILGAQVEVKLAGEETFELLQLRDFYTEPDCFFYVYLPDLNLALGENIVRVMHLGGPFLRDNKIYISEDSSYISFSVMVNAQGIITVNEI